MQDSNEMLLSPITKYDFGQIHRDTGYGKLRECMLQSLRTKTSIL